MARTREGPPANSRQGTKALSATTHEDLKFANNIVKELGSQSFPAQAHGRDGRPVDIFLADLQRALS